VSTPTPPDAPLDREAAWLRNTYRPDEPNLTLRAALVGMVIGVVMCLSNLYVVLEDRVEPRRDGHRVHPRVRGLSPVAVGCASSPSR
jgi:hypothetical protein